MLLVHQTVVHTAHKETQQLHNTVHPDVILKRAVALLKIVSAAQKKHYMYLPHDASTEIFCVRL